MIRKVYELVPKILADELVRLAKTDRDWIECEQLEGLDYRIHSKLKTWVKELIKSGADGYSMLATSIWLADGPKAMTVTPEQCDALENVEVRLPLTDYQQPYPALLIEFPRGRYGWFDASIVCLQNDKKIGRVLTLVGVTPSRLQDITTTVSELRLGERPIEESLSKFYDDITVSEAETYKLASRVAVNACLALANYGGRLEWLLPKDVERDQRFAKEKSERGERARERLRTAIKEVKLDSSIRLHRVEEHVGGGEGTGREMRTHWRRGHWHTVLHGVGRSQRRLAFYPPVLVRADRAVVDTSEMSTTYKT